MVLSRVFVPIQIRICSRTNDPGLPIAHGQGLTLLVLDRTKVHFERCGFALQRICTGASTTVTWRQHGGREGNRAQHA
jgi:hypothetical protein